MPKEIIYRVFCFFCFIMPVVAAAQSAAPADSVKNNQPGFFKNLDNKGISFGLNEDLEGYYNFTGGIKSGSAYASTLDANITFDLEKLLRIPGASLYFDLEDHRGDNPSNTLTGDLQIFDKHNAAPFFQALELWYQQELFQDKLRIKIGKIDANSEFSVIDNGLPFINSSTQVTPTLFVFPTFPDPVPAVNIFFTPNKIFYTNFAIDDANQSEHFLNFYGDPTSVQPTLHGQLFLSESGFNWEKFPGLKKDGNIKIGLWTHNGTFTKFDGNTQHGAKGAYFILDQSLYHSSKPGDENDGSSVGMFLEYALTEKALTPIYQHIGGGLLYKGLLKNDHSDATGLSIHYTNLSPGLGVTDRYELNLETFYKISLTNWLSVKSDFQYIINPGGQFSNDFLGIMVLSISLNS